MRSARKILFLLSISAHFISAAKSNASESNGTKLTGNEIVARADIGKLSIGPVSFTAKVTDSSKGSEVRETHYRVITAGKAASRVETIFPERQKGRKLLMKEDNLWLYTPTTKRPVRVTMQQRLTGEIANGDLARTNFSGDYEASLIGKVEISGKSAYHLKLKASRAGVTYSKIDYWVSASDFLPVRAEFYAVSGKLLKTGTYSEPKMVLGHKCITKIVFADALDRSKNSELAYSGFKRETESSVQFSKESLSD